MAGNSEKPSAIDAAWQLVTQQRTILTDEDIDAYLFPGGTPGDPVESFNLDLQVLRGSTGDHEADESGLNRPDNTCISNPPGKLSPSSSEIFCSNPPGHRIDGDVVSLTLYNEPRDLLACIEESEALYEVAQAECNVSQVQLGIQSQLRKEEVVQCENGERFVMYPELNEQPSSSSVSKPEWDPDATTLEEQILTFIANMNLLMRSHEKLGDLQVQEFEEQHDSDDNELSPIFNLPDELLLRIFSYIPLEDLCLSVSPVCRHWRLLSHDPSLWTKIVLQSNAHMDPHWLCYLINRSRLLKSLSIRNPSSIREESVNVFSNYCPLLQEIDFGFCSITPSMLNTLVTRCPSIRRANFEGCENVDISWMKILCKLQHLEDINLCYCSSIQDAAILHLAENTKKLRRVSIDGNSFLTDLSVMRIVTRHHTTLERYNIDGWENTDECVKSLSKCKRLTQFTISFSSKITHLSVSTFQDMTNLTHLQIRKNEELSTHDLIQIFLPPAMQNLTYLDLSECLMLDDTAVKAFCNSCLKLRSLVLHWCWHITETGIEIIVDKLCDLEHLDLLGLDQINGTSFAKLPLKLPHLKFLNLVQCNKIKDDLICQVLGRMPQLEAINFYQENFRDTNHARRPSR